MGQVIHLSVPWAAYPVITEALDTAECILLFGVRWWAADYRQGVDPMPRLCEAMRTAGPRDAAFSVDRLMAVIARTAGGRSQSTARAALTCRAMKRPCCTPPA